MAFWHSSRAQPPSAAFLDAAKQFTQDSGAYAEMLRSAFSSRISVAYNSCDSLFARGQTLVLSAARINSESAVRQSEAIAPFAARPKSQTPANVVAALAEMFGAVGACRRDGCREIAGIGRSIAEMAVAFVPDAIAGDEFAADVRRLRRKAERGESADQIALDDEDDFIIVGPRPPPAPAAAVAIEGLLVDEEVLESPRDPVLDALDDDRLGELNEVDVWPIMAIESPQTAIEGSDAADQPPGEGVALVIGTDDALADGSIDEFPAEPVLGGPAAADETGNAEISVDVSEAGPVDVSAEADGALAAEEAEADGDLDGFWEGISNRPPILIGDDPLSLLIQEAAARELKRRELGRVPGPVRRGRAAAGDGESAGSPERRGRKKAVDASPP